MSGGRPYGGDITDSQLKSEVARHDGRITCLKYYVICQPTSLQMAEDIVKEVDNTESHRLIVK